MTQRELHTCAHRVTAQVIAARNADPIPDAKIPRATALSWSRRELGNAVSLDEVGQTEAHFRERIAKLDRGVFAHPGTWFHVPTAREAARLLAK